MSLTTRFPVTLLIVGYTHKGPILNCFQATSVYLLVPLPPEQVKLGGLLRCSGRTPALGGSIRKCNTLIVVEEACCYWSSKFYSHSFSCLLDVI